MTTYSATVNTWTNNSDANFRVWGSAIETMFTALGATKVWSNFDWATVLTPTTLQQIQGSDIWRFNDGIGNYYIKFNYGSSSASVNNPRIRMYFGFDHDGAGNVTPENRLCSDYDTSGVTTPVSVYGSVIDGVFSFVLPGGLYVFERRRNQQTGAYVTDDDITVFSATTGSSYGATFASTRRNPYSKFGVGSTAPGPAYCVIPWNPTASTSGVGNISIWPWRASYPASHIAVGGCTYIATEIAKDTTFDVAILGGTMRKYRATGQGGAANWSQSYAGAILWE